MNFLEVAFVSIIIVCAIILLLWELYISIDSYTHWIYTVALSISVFGMIVLLITIWR